jgi:hypothetical protein
MTRVKKCKNKTYVLFKKKHYNDAYNRQCSVKKKKTKDAAFFLLINKSFMKNLSLLIKN